MQIIGGVILAAFFPCCACLIAVDLIGKMLWAGLDLIAIAFSAALIGTKALGVFVPLWLVTLVIGTLSQHAEALLSVASPTIRLTTHTTEGAGMTPQRDTLKPPAYWDDYITYQLETRLPKFRAKAEAATTTPKHRCRLLYSIFRETLHLLIARYSRGDDLTVLRTMFSTVVQALQDYQAQPEHEPYDFDYFDGYVRALGLVALGILLKTDTQTFTRLLDAINQSARDALFDRLVALRQGPALFTTKLLYPRPYRLLYEALDAPDSKRSPLLTGFLQQYYPAMQDTYWHDSHQSEGASFFGYWCFELAAFCRELAWDEPACIDSPYYPRAWREEQEVL